jgi:effector-binding domain-containing protein
VKPRTIDFEFARAPAYRVASIAWTGPWNEKRIQAQFERVEAWAKRAGLRTGRWIFREPGSRRWEASVEVKGAARSAAPVRIKTLPAARVARVVFDPDVVSPRVVYHGLSDWLRWRKREKEIRSVVSTREVYAGNPWREAKAWARTEVQFVVRK